MENLQTQTHSSSPISAGWKANFKLVNAHAVKWFPIDWEWGGVDDWEGLFAIEPTAKGKLRSQERERKKEA